MNCFRSRFSPPATVWTISLAVTLLFFSRSSRGNLLEDSPVKFHPHLDLQATYDDNILISSTNKLGDFSFMIRPGLQLVYGDLNRNYLSLDYTAGIEEFYRHTEFNAVNHYVTFGGKYNFSRLKLQIDHQFKDETSEDFEAGTRLQQEQNLTSASAEYNLSHYFSIGALYHQELHHFPTPGQIDNELYQPGVALYYHLSPKTDIFGEFDYGWAEVARGENQQSETGTLGLRGKITSKITGRIGVGYQNTDYSGSSPSVDTVSASVSLHGDFTRHTFADFVVERRINPSTTFTNNSVTTTRADLTVNQRIYKEKFLVYLGGAYQRDEYNQPVATGVTRTDDIWEGRAGVRYLMKKWLEFGASYRYQHNASTAPGVSFNQDVVSVDALLHF